MKKSNPLRLHFILFVILSIVAVAQLSWWVIYQVQEGARIKSLQHEIWHQQIRTTVIYFDTAELSRVEKTGWLKGNFPDLQLDESREGLTVTEAAELRLDNLANKRVRMFVSEAAFFSLLVLSGVWFFYWALRKRIELENKTSAILGSAYAGMKNPVSAIERDMEELLNSQSADPAQKNLLSDISSNMRKISDICENVSLVQTLAVSKRKMDFVVTDISEAAESLVREYKASLLRSNFTLDSNIEKGLTAVTNPAQWSKIVLGFLRVAENNSAENGPIKFGLERSGDLAVLKIRVGLESEEEESESAMEKVESELSMIKELAETIGVEIKVNHKGGDIIGFKAELPLLEE